MTRGDPPRHPWSESIVALLAFVLFVGASSLLIAVLL